DSKRIAHCAVCSRASALNEDSLIAAEVDDVPDDQEITFELEFFDQRQLAFDLLPRSFVCRRVLAGVADPRAFIGALAKKRRHRFPIGHRIARKLIAQIFESEAEPR